MATYDARGYLVWTLLGNLFSLRSLYSKFSSYPAELQSNIPLNCNPPYGPLILMRGQTKLKTATSGSVIHYRRRSCQDEGGATHGRASTRRHTHTHTTRQCRHGHDCQQHHRQHQACHLWQWHRIHRHHGMPSVWLSITRPANARDRGLAVYGFNI